MGFCTGTTAASDDVLEKALIGAADDVANDGNRDGVAAEFGEFAAECGHDDVVVTVSDVAGELALEVAADTRRPFSVDPLGQRVLYAFEDVHVWAPLPAWVAEAQLAQPPQKAGRNATCPLHNGREHARCGVDVCVAPKHPVAK